CRHGRRQGVGSRSDGGDGLVVPARARPRMNRLSALLLAIALAACSRALPAGVEELTYATPYPPSHPFSRADQRWIDHVESASNGSLRIRPIWSGALLSSDMSMEELRYGVAD